MRAAGAGASTTLCDWREADAPRVDLSNVHEECPAAYGHGHARREPRSPTHLIAAEPDESARSCDGCLYKLAHLDHRIEAARVGPR